MSKKGFTLVDLLVTIAVIGIISAMGVSNFNSYRQKAYYVAAVAQLRDLNTSLQGGDGLSDCSTILAFYYTSTNTTNPDEINCGGATITVNSTNIVKYIPGFKKNVLVRTTLNLTRSGTSTGYSTHCKSSDSTVGYAYPGYKENASMTNGLITKAYPLFPVTCPPGL